MLVLVTVVESIQLFDLYYNYIYYDILIIYFIL